MKLNNTKVGFGGLLAIATLTAALFTNSKSPADKKWPKRSLI